MNIFAAIGRMVLAFLAEIGALTVFTVSAVTNVIRPPIYWSLIGQQVMRIGWFSLPVVGLTAFFTGGVLALQIYIGGNRYGAEAIVPMTTIQAVLAVLRYLGVEPALSGAAAASAACSTSMKDSVRSLAS